MSLGRLHLFQYLLMKSIKCKSFMSDFSQIAFVLGLKQGIILSLDKRVYLTLAHHNTLQHLGSNDLYCTIFSSPVKLELSQFLSQIENTQ